MKAKAKLPKLYFWSSSSVFNVSTYRRMVTRENRYTNKFRLAKTLLSLVMGVATGQADPDAARQIL